jgi:hypothetical protein
VLRQRLTEGGDGAAELGGTEAVEGRHRLGTLPMPRRADRTPDPGPLVPSGPRPAHRPL